MSWKRIILLTGALWSILLLYLFTTIPRIACTTPTDCSPPYGVHIEAFFVLAPLLLGISILLNYPPSRLKEWVRS